jgi:hypothetical protein
MKILARRSPAAELAATIRALLPGRQLHDDRLLLKRSNRFRTRAEDNVKFTCWDETIWLSFMGNSDQK